MQITVSDRQDWMSTLARAPAPLLESLWSAFDDKPKFTPLRAPETGLVMIRARAGGEGGKFNLGEATVTRCAVVSDAGQTGHAYVLGRSSKHALTAAEVDAVLQDQNMRPKVMDAIVKPLKSTLEKAKLEHRGKVAATKVDFFTLVRGEVE